MKMFFVLLMTLGLIGCAPDSTPSLTMFDGTFVQLSSTCSGSTGTVAVIEQGRLVGAPNFDFNSPGVATIDQNGLLTVIAPSGCISRWQRQ